MKNVKIKSAKKQIVVGLFILMQVAPAYATDMSQPGMGVPTSIDSVGGDTSGSIGGGGQMGFSLQASGGVSGGVTVGATAGGECAGISDEEQRQRCVLTLAARDSNCVSCLEQLSIQQPKSNAWLEALGLVATPLAIVGSTWISSAYQDRSQRRWANAYKYGQDACNTRVTNVLDYNTSMNAGALSDDAMTNLTSSCNGSSMNGYAGYGNMFGNGYGGVGSPYISAGYTGGYMNGMQGPYMNGAMMYPYGMNATMTGAYPYTGGGAGINANIGVGGLPAMLLASMMGGGGINAYAGINGGGYNPYAVGANGMYGPGAYGPGGIYSQNGMNNGLGIYAQGNLGLPGMNNGMNGMYGPGFNGNLGVPGASMNGNLSYPGGQMYPGLNGNINLGANVGMNNYPFNNAGSYWGNTGGGNPFINGGINVGINTGMPNGNINGGWNPNGGMNGNVGWNPNGGVNGGWNPNGGVNGGWNPNGGVNGGWNPNGGVNGGWNPNGGMNGGMNQAQMQYSRDMANVQGGAISYNDRNNAQASLYYNSQNAQNAYASYAMNNGGNAFSMYGNAPYMQGNLGMQTGFNAYAGFNLGF